MIHLNLSCKMIHIHLLTFCVLHHLLKCAPSLKWLCHQSITHKLNMKLPKWLKTPIICKKSWIFFKMWQCDWKHSNTHVMIGLCFFIWNVEHIKPWILKITIYLTCWWVHFPTLGNFTKGYIMWILSKLWKILILNEFSFIAIYASISFYNSTFLSCS